MRVRPPKKVRGRLLPWLHSDKLFADPTPSSPAFHAPSDRGRTRKLLQSSERTARHSDLGFVVALRPRTDTPPNNATPLITRVGAPGTGPPISRTSVPPKIPAV